MAELRMEDLELAIATSAGVAAVPSNLATTNYSLVLQLCTFNIHDFVN
jgi:hypothetical protein